MSWVGSRSITERSMCLCIPIPAMNYATIGTAHYGLVEAINWTFGRSAAKGSGGWLAPRAGAHPKPVRSGAEGLERVSWVSS